MSDHSIIAPSSAHRWVNCTASAMLSRLLPERESNAKADLGTRLHEAAATGDTTGLDPEHVKWVETYRSLVPDGLYEEKISKSIVHPMHFGTVDFISYVRTSAVLTIVDFKTGKWAVDATENWQLIGYAAEMPFAETYKLGIFQPAISMKPKWWVLSAEQFEPYAKRYREAAHAAFDNPTFYQGEWCKFCPAKGAVCDAVRGRHVADAKEW